MNARNLRKFVGALAVLVWGHAPLALAQVSFDFDHRFQNGTVTDLPAPYVTATFTDASDGVLLDIHNTSNAPGALNSIYFNIESYANANPLTWGWQSGAMVAASNGVRQGLDARKADGDGYYDLELNYTGTSFGPNSHSVYKLSGTGLTASSFFSLSSPSGGYFPFYAAAHTGGSWVAAIPEPETYAMLAAGLMLMGWVARRRKQTMDVDPD